MLNWTTVQNGVSMAKCVVDGGGSSFEGGWGWSKVS